MLLKRKKGFTLIELLIIMAILAGISTIAVVTYRQGRAHARDQQRIITLSQFRAALEDYYDEFEAYVCGDGATAWERPVGSGNYYTINSSTSPGFLDGFPGESGNGDGCLYHNQMVAEGEMDGYPEISYLEDGLGDANYLADGWPVDPINESPYKWWYASPIHGRGEFVIWAVLEEDTELMKTDGGVCDNQYEVYSQGWFPDHADFRFTGYATCN